MKDFAIAFVQAAIVAAAFVMCLKLVLFLMR